MYSNRYTDDIEQFANEQLQQRRIKSKQNMGNTTTLKPGINLYDVLPLHIVKKSKNKEKTELIEKILKEKNDFFNFYNYLQKYFPYSYRSDSSDLSVLNDANENFGVINKINKDRKIFFEKYGYLPDEILDTLKVSKNFTQFRLEERSDGLSKLSQCAKIKGSDVKDIIDKFNFIGIPYSCLNEKSFEHESYDIKKNIKNFNSLLKNDYEVYVITPIEYYSLENHVNNNTEEKGIYAGKHSMVFTSIIINIPMFRTLLNKIEDNSDGIRDLKSENQQIKKSLDQVNNTLVQLQKQIDKQQTLLIQQQIEIKKQAEEQIRFQEMMLRIIDPVMIAFKKNVDINSDEFDDEICYVGPCWGPDFDEKVSLALDIKVFNNQRKKLEKISNEIWS